MVSARAHCFSRYSSFSGVVAPRGATCSASGKQSQSVAISRNPWQLAPPARQLLPRNQWQSVAISGNHLPDGEAHLKQLGLIDFAAAVRIIPARGNQMVISGHQWWTSVDISGHQWPSVAISGGHQEQSLHIITFGRLHRRSRNQWPSMAINGNQWESVAIIITFGRLHRRSRAPCARPPPGRRWAHG